MKFEQKTIDKIAARVKQRFGNEADSPSSHRVENFTLAVCELMLPSDLPIGEQPSLMPPTIPMLIWCPECGQRHVDRGEFATKIHHTHSCQFCGHTWRPAVVATVGVQFLPGFKDKP